MNYKQKALDHVRSVCSELGFVDALDNQVWRTPHLEHWLRGIDGTGATWELDSSLTDSLVMLTVYDIEKTAIYNLTKDGENQSEEFYKVYCEIVGITRPQLSKSMNKLQQTLEKGREDFERNHRLEDGRIADIGFQGGTIDDWLQSHQKDIVNAVIAELDQLWQKQLCKNESDKGYIAVGISHAKNHLKTLIE